VTAHCDALAIWLLRLHRFDIPILAKILIAAAKIGSSAGDFWEL
jgi:hypothetical protein